MAIDKAQKILQSTFGYDTFRGSQEEIIQYVLNQNDSLVLMPTGGGKSLCFQIPALLFEHLTIVVSPLISLMQDQVAALQNQGVEADFFNSTQSSAEKNGIIQRCYTGTLKLLYMAPETLLTASESWLQKMQISLFAIDEAHCVSSWGHDFRPEYAQIGKLRKLFSDVPFVALTATADKAVRKDILERLHLRAPKVFISSFDRPNLELVVKGNLKRKDKVKDILSFLHNNADTSGIIYCLSRKETEQWAEELQQNGFQASCYHAGMPSSARASIQRDFINDDLPIICATIAFGMGIDKSNVRWIIHNNLPKNIENYYQEIGRAGRDGLPAKTLLYFSYKDVVLLSQFIRDSEHTIVGMKKLKRMQQYAEATSCRRRVLLSYFGQQLEEDCGNCDVCHNPPDFINGTVIAQKALSAIKRTHERVATTLLIKVLRGATSQDVMNRGFHLIKTHGAGADYSESQWQHFVGQFINLGLIDIAYDDYLSLKITDLGNEVLFGKRTIHLTQPPDRKESVKKQKTAKKLTILPEADESLFTTLKQLRSKIAKQQGVPAYIVFHDSALSAMAGTKPSSLAEMEGILGVGKAKLDKYGELFLQCILEHSSLKNA